MATRTCADWFVMLAVVLPLVLVLAGVALAIRLHPIPDAERARAARRAARLAGEGVGEG